MPTHTFGWVEPTCGLARGSTAIARGDFALAWRYNPASFAVIAFGLAGIIRVAVGTVSGRWLSNRHSSARRRLGRARRRPTSLCGYTSSPTPNSSSTRVPDHDRTRPSPTEHHHREQFWLAMIAACCAGPMLIILVLTAVLGIAIGPAAAITIGLVAGAVCLTAMVARHRHGARSGRTVGVCV